MYAIFKHMYNTEFEKEEAKQTDGVQTSINLLRTDREKTWRRCQGASIFTATEGCLLY